MHPLLRFTLDLFDSTQLFAASQKTNDNGEAARKKRSGALKTVTEGFHTETMPTHFSVPISFRHPNAGREIQLLDSVVAYEFIRGNRRSIGFSVGPQGLTVRAPKWAPHSEIDAALIGKSAWILRKLHESRVRHASQIWPITEWRDGSTLLFLGKSITLLLDPEHNFASAGAELMPVDEPTTEKSARCLHLSLAHNATAEQIRDATQAWMMVQAHQLFLARLAHFAPMLNVHWKALRLSNAGTRWGSAKSDGSIRLNWRLIHLKPEVIDYVVAHELSHLREMNHGPRFWSTVQSVIPDYLELRRQLKQTVLPNSV